MLNKCPRCGYNMEKWVACELRCHICGGLLDCSDLASNGE